MIWRWYESAGPRTVAWPLITVAVVVGAMAGIAKSQTPSEGGMPPVGMPAQIEQRGYVNNMCEAEMMLQRMVSAQGGQQMFGDYKVVYMHEGPRGWYEPAANGRTKWRSPASGENQHIEAAIFDSLTGKMLPIQPTVDVIDSQGNVIESKKLDFLWRPMVDHYGANFKVPSAGTYTLRIRGDAPRILRYDKDLGNRFCAPIDVRFSGVSITPQQPEASDMGG